MKSNTPIDQELDGRVQDQVEAGLIKLFDSIPEIDEILKSDLIDTLFDHFDSKFVSKQIRVEGVKK